jgi:hypothetical protein
MAQPKWLEMSFVHHDMIRRSEKETAEHHHYSDAQVRQAIMHARQDLTILISLLTTTCRFLSAILLVLRMLCFIIFVLAVWSILK